MLVRLLVISVEENACMPSSVIMHWTHNNIVLTLRADTAIKLSPELKRKKVIFSIYLQYDRELVIPNRLVHSHFEQIFNFCFAVFLII